MSRFSILEYSTHWFRYPYPQIRAVEGPVSGMEYPMVAMEAPGDDETDLYNVITHEIGHMWYPMTVGSDERRYAWMDEGFNTFINTFSEEDYWKRDDTDTRRNEIQFVTALDQAPDRAADHDAGQPVPQQRQSRQPGVREAVHHAPRAPEQGAGPGSLRHRVPRVHPAVGLQASPAGGFLPHHRGGVGPGSRVVLARASSTRRRRSTRAWKA